MKLLFDGSGRLRKKRFLPIFLPLLLIPAAVLLFATFASGAAGIVRVSTGSGGEEGNEDSGTPNSPVSVSVSANGRYVAFASYASNLTGDTDTNSSLDIFRKDNNTGEIILVSAEPSGNAGNGNSINPAISPDGRYVAFDSDASNLVASDTNTTWPDVFVRDTQTGTTTLVSTNSAGVQGGWRSSNPSISASGGYVSFYSYNALVADGGTGGIFVKNISNNETERITVDSDEAVPPGQPGYDYSSTITPDGRFVVFSSAYGAFVENDTSGYYDVFVRDRQEGTTTRVSTDSAGVEGNEDSGQFGPSAISNDGRYVAFRTKASNLVDGDSGVGLDIIRKDSQTGATTLISASPAGIMGDTTSDRPSMSADGRYVAFQSQAGNLVENDTNGAHLDIYVKDAQTGALAILSTDTNGVQGTQNSFDPSISADGLLVGFWTENALVPEDTGFRDIYLSPVDFTTGLTVEKTVSYASVDGLVRPGEVLTYTITVSNTGHQDAMNVTVADPGPNNTSAPVLEPGSSWTPGNVARGGQAQVVYTVTVDDPLPWDLDTLENTATVSAGNSDDAADSVSIGADPAGREYYVPWYDTIYGNTWMLAATPMDGVSNAFDIYLRNSQTQQMELLTSGGPFQVTPGETVYKYYDGRMDGPVAVRSTNGPALVSERSLFGNSFEEVWATPYDELDSHYWWPFYGSTGTTQNWVLVANPPANPDAVTARVKIHGTSVNETKNLAPGESWTPMFPGVAEGPVEVTAWLQGETEGAPADARKVIASQRVLMNGAFNEFPGMAASALDSLYMWTWYDYQSPGSANWIMLSNPGDADIWVGVLIGDLNAPLYGNFGKVESRKTVVAQAPGVMGGPVTVFGCANEDDDCAVPADLIASQRAIWGPSISEVAGTTDAQTGTSVHWTWYDNLSPGVTNWVLVANPDPVNQIYAEVLIKGVSKWTGDIGPLGRETPTFPEVMDGPVEVRAYDHEALPRTEVPVMASQRVLWNGYFNEIVGKKVADPPLIPPPVT